MLVAPSFRGHWLPRVHLARRQARSKPPLTDCRSRSAVSTNHHHPLCCRRHQRLPPSWTRRYPVFVSPAVMASTGLLRQTPSRERSSHAQLWKSTRVSLQTRMLNQKPCLQRPKAASPVPWADTCAADAAAAAPAGGVSDSLRQRAPSTDTTFTR